MAFEVLSINRIFSEYSALVERLSTQPPIVPHVLKSMHPDHRCLTFFKIRKGQVLEFSDVAVKLRWIEDYDHGYDYEAYCLNYDIEPDAEGGPMDFARWMRRPKDRSVSPVYAVVRAVGDLEGDNRSGFTQRLSKFERFAHVLHCLDRRCAASFDYLRELHETSSWLKFLSPQLFENIQDVYAIPNEFGCTHHSPPASHSDAIEHLLGGYSFTAFDLTSGHGHALFSIDCRMPIYKAITAKPGFSISSDGHEVVLRDSAPTIARSGSASACGNVDQQRIDVVLLTDREMRLGLGKETISQAVG